MSEGDLHVSQTTSPRAIAGRSCWLSSGRCCRGRPPGRCCSQTVTAFSARTGQDPAPVSTRELLRRTSRVDHPNRGHRPDADLRRAAPASGTCRVRVPLQRPAATSGAATAAAAPDITGSRAGPWQDPASTDTGRPSQRVRDSSLKPLVKHHGRVLAPDRHPRVSRFLLIRCRRRPRLRGRPGFLAGWPAQGTGCEIWRR